MKKLFSILFTTLLASCVSLAKYKDTPLIEEVTTHRSTTDAKKIDELVKKGQGSANEVYAGASVLLYAMMNVDQERKLEVVAKLLDLGADVNFSGTYDVATLHSDEHAPGHNNTHAFQLKAMEHPSRLMQGPLVNHVILYSYYKITPSDLDSWLKLLKSARFNAMQISSGRNTPLHVAALESISKDRLNLVVRFLIENGADCLYKNSDGESPLILVTQKANEKLKSEFIDLCSSSKK